MVDDLPEPDPADGEVLVEGLAAGLCGTDREIIAGLYGTRGHDGFARDRWRVEAGFAVRLDPGLGPGLGPLGVLFEPTSVVSKAWEHVERIGRRAHWEPQTVLITGAGPIGLLAAMLAVQRGLSIHVLDLTS